MAAIGLSLLANGADADFDAADMVYVNAGTTGRRLSRKTLSAFCCVRGRRGANVRRRAGTRTPHLHELGCLFARWRSHTRAYGASLGPRAVFYSAMET
jgi:hypothetical protein